MVSVVVPVYKVEKYLNRCIQSILGQTLSDFELILVDDGSPDRCGEMCDTWAEEDSRIRVVHKQNGGLSSARNAGLDVARGNYVTFIDSDDAIHPQYLEHLLDLCEQNKAEISMGKLTRFQTMEVPDDQPLPQLQCEIHSGHEVIAFTMEDWKKASNYISACCKLYRRELFENIRFPEGRLFEDEFTTYKLYDRANRIADAQSVLYFYFENENSITANLDLLKYTDEFAAQWEQICYFREKGYSDLFAAAVKRYLRTAQWDIAKSRTMRDMPPKIQEFQTRFRQVLTLAQENQLVDFLQDYDYYILAYPERKTYYRLKRLLKKGIAVWKRGVK